MWLLSQATNDVLQPGTDFLIVTSTKPFHALLCASTRRGASPPSIISLLEPDNLQRLVVMYNLNPACYVPSGVARYLPSSIACAPPPSYFAQAYSALTSPFTSTYSTLRTLMDAVVSLPALSFLLIPTMTSYSTSLNLLFFYITWSTLYVSRIICDDFLDLAHYGKERRDKRRR